MSNIHHFYKLFEPYLLLAPTLVVALFSFYNFKVVPKPAQSVIELINDFFYDQFHDFFLAEENYQRWIPFFISLFYYILINNLMGIIPGLHPQTADINVTASLSLMIFFITILTSIREHGVIKFLKNLVPTGIPFIIRIFMFPIEIISKLATPFSLAIRLFANMTAGHMIIVVLLLLNKFFTSYLIIPVDIVAVSLMMGFEVMVSFIQAYIFVYLSVLFFTETMYHHNHAMLCTFKKLARKET